MNKRVEQGRSTRSHLVATARRLFTERGYHDTPVEALLDAAGVSRGAFYHHFESKEALFDAVLVDVESELAAKAMRASAQVTEPVEALAAGCRHFLRQARDPAIRRIVLLDAPGVVGWDRWREIDAANAFGMLKLGVEVAAAQAGLPPHLALPLAHVVLASLLELALVVARSDKPKAATADAEEAMTLVLEGLFGRAVSRP